MSRLTTEQQRSDIIAPVPSVDHVPSESDVPVERPAEVAADVSAPGRGTSRPAPAQPRRDEIARSEARVIASVAAVQLSEVVADTEAQGFAAGAPLRVTRYRLEAGVVVTLTEATLVDEETVAAGLAEARA